VSIFISCQDIDSPYVERLFAALREVALPFFHSPPNPMRRPDAAWVNWYDQGLPATLARTSGFLIVIDSGWDSSTWMGIEAHTAIARISGEHLRFFAFVNPNQTLVRARGMLPYLREEFPSDLSALLPILLRRLNSSNAASDG
jgi:hypothetical protein